MVFAEHTRSSNGISIMKKVANLISNAVKFPFGQHKSLLQTEMLEFGRFRMIFNSCKPV